MINNLFQDAEFLRLTLIYGVHIAVAGIFFTIMYKILKRQKNPLTITLSSHYISVAVGLIINAIYVPLRENPIVIILHLITVFCILFGLIFLVLFTRLLYSYEYQRLPSNMKKILFFYGFTIIAMLVLFAASGDIAINEQTGWRPVWSWRFFTIIYIFCFGFIIIPFSVLFYRIYRVFREKVLKKRLIYFFIGFCGLLTGMMGGFLYNTWSNPVFQFLWPIIIFFIGIPSGILIYYGVATKLET